MVTAHQRFELHQQVLVDRENFINQLFGGKTPLVSTKAAAIHLADIRDTLATRHLGVGSPDG